MKAPFTLFLLLFFYIGFTQVPTLSLEDEWAKSIEIKALSVDVKIVGNIATTTFDMLFYNPNRRDLEGELSMPLSEGQEICRYALDVNGTLREGVLVEKVKARQAFEAVVRQNIDPGIVNLTKGNYFKTRIYPIPRKGQKRVVLALSETLNGDEKNLYYSLPMEQPTRIGTFNLDVRVIKSETDHEYSLGEFHNVRFDNRNEALVLSMERKDFKTNEPLKFTIPRFGGGDHQLFTCEWEGETYFYLNAQPPALTQSVRTQPSKVAIFWDRSSSGAKRNLGKELSLLADYVKSLPELKQITLSTFGTTVDTEIDFKDDIAELIRYLRGLRYDGATRLDHLSFNNEADEILLFSDGINTIGTTFKDLPKIPIHSISSGSGSNYGLLRKVSGKTGGTFLNLAAMTKEKALERLRYDVEQFISVSYKRSELKEVYPDLPQRVGPNMEIVGILKNEKADLIINYGAGRKVTKSQSFVIAKGAKAPVSRIWASKKIASLNNDYEQNRAAILALGQTHKIVTKNTSFIVLDRVEDYVEHKIVPPVELLSEYNRMLARKQKRRDDPQAIIRANNRRIRELKGWYVSPPVLLRERSRTTGAVTRAAEPDSFDADDFDAEVVEEMIMEDAAFSNVEGTVAGAVSRMSTQSDEAPDESKGPSIKVLAWLPDAAYLEVLRVTSEEALEDVYFEQKAEHHTRPAFYIQVADFFYEKGRVELASRILSNTIEMDLENPELLRVVAKRFQEEGELDMSIALYQEIRKLRPEEPQSYRDLALVYEEIGRYQEALDLYLYLMNGQWERFEEIKLVILNELNRLIAAQEENLNLEKIPEDWVYAMPLDVRIVIDWSSNDNDIDLWVIDPHGDKCYYGQKFTEIGGKISADFTQGYGPEEYTLKEAKRGFYTVYVNYFSESRQTITGPVTIYATLYTNYGTLDRK